MSLGTIVLGVQGWPIERLWFYLVGSALLILVGLQLVISWILMRTLEELSEREIRARRDLSGGGLGVEAVVGGVSPSKRSE